MSSRLIFLDYSKSNQVNSKYEFKFDRGINIKSYRIKQLIHSILYNNMSKIYIHSPELSQALVNKNIDGDGHVSDIIGLVSGSTFDLDRHTLFLNREKTFHKITIYFTDKDGNFVSIPDFCLVLDVQKNYGIV